MTAFLLMVALTLPGCSDDDDDDQSGGIVSQLTGDPDDQVSPTLQQQVSTAVSRGPFDEPADF